MPRHPLTNLELAAAAEPIAELVALFRPDWPAHIVRSILESHPRAAALPTAIAALRAAGDPDLPHPRAIMWKGKHWSGLEGDLPESVRPQERCTICGKLEADCYTAPGRHLDDHAFTPPVRR
jgi:hypothetical protein